MSGRKRDDIWEDYEEIKEGTSYSRAQCNHCKKKMAGLVARMKKHLQNECPIVSETQQSSSKESGTKRPSMSDSNQPTKKVKTSNTMNNFIHATTDKQKKDLDEQVARFIFGTNSPFQLVEHTEFKKFVYMLRPGYDLPNRKKVGGELLDKVYEKEKTNMATALKNQIVCLSLDGWSNVRNESIISSCVVDKMGNAYLVDSEDTSGHSHTAEYMTSFVESTITKTCDMYECDIGSIVTDNAPNMLAMHKNLSRPNANIITIGCGAHNLNLLAKDFDMPTATKHVEKIVKYFRNNHFARAKFDEHKDGHNLVLPLEIRWNTMCACLEIFLENWLTLLKICEEYPDKIDKDIKKLVCDISIKRTAQDLVAILKPISIASAKIQSNTCNIADAVKIWKNLKTELYAVLNSAQKKIFVKRYEKALSSSHFLAYMLSPKYMLDDSIELTEQEKEATFDYVKSSFGDAGIDLTTKLLKLKLRVAPFTGALMDVQMMTSLTAIEWWKSIQDVKNICSEEEMRIIMQHLTASASSASVERIFSIFGLVHSDIRNRLGTEKAAKLVMIYKQLNS